MAHFAEVDEGGVVTRVIVADQAFIDSGKVGDPSRWKQTSYGTRGGLHVEGGTPVRKNFAGIGYTYDRKLDAFIPPRPHPSWSLDEESCSWIAPKARPANAADGVFDWDESKQEWKKIAS